MASVKSRTTSPNAATHVTAAGTTQRPRRSAVVNSAATGRAPSSWTRWGERPGHPFGILFMRKATVGKRLAQHGDDTLTVTVGRPEIAGRGARGHVRTIPRSGTPAFCPATNGSGSPLALGRVRSG